MGTTIVRASVVDLGPYEVDSIVVGDCVDVMRRMPDGCVDLVVADPPYPREYQYLYEYLAKDCPRIMRNGASLLTIVPHYALPDIIHIFDGNLKYRWAICMNQSSGKHPRMAMGIEVMWKPILWYVKGTYPQGKGFVRDGFNVNGTEGQEKNLHQWQQDTSWAAFLISKFSESDDLVFDPFMGSGTTAVAAKKLGRHWFGCDINSDYVRMARERVAKVQPRLL